jgi:hypothetical protein
MIELGQLRRWKKGFVMRSKSRVFLVSNHVGKFYPQGARHLVLEDHWDIVDDGNLLSGWSSSLLEELSEAVDGAQ